MTRFARADGSKGSNKREPEEATPWSVMVKQIQANQTAGVEDEVEYDGGVEEEMEFQVLDEDEDVVEEDDALDTSILDEIDSGEQLAEPASGSLQSLRETNLVSAEEPKKKKRKKSEKCKICGEKGHRKMDCERLPEERRKELQELYTMKVERKGKGTGRKKSKNKNQNEGVLPFEAGSIEEEVGVKESENNNKTADMERFKHKPSKKMKKDKSGAIVEAGEGLFQGFRVKMEDQERLHKLYKQLKGKGIPKQELEAAMKKERRIAEKSLARSKKLVCFNCRQPGHMLADCPSAKTEESDMVHAASGHCFKCGSLEHTSKDCKSKLRRENAYRFAVCFICKQEGHLAKTCPDNPKGLYPKGGGCVFCGSVEHLKRDCPRKVEKDLKQGVRVGTIGDTNLEEEQEFDTAKMIKQKNKMKMKKEKKVVVF